MTTLDKTAWIQHVKIFYSMVRAIFYTLPEIFVLMIVAAAPIFLIVKKQDRWVFAAHGTTFSLLLLFPSVMLVAYGLADLPFDPKYLVLASLLLTVYGLYPVLIGFERLSVPIACISQAAIAILMALTALSAAPSYLRYKNIFRDRSQDNAQSYDMDHYIWWTMPGWGETTYPISRYLESHMGGPITVAFDNNRPFYSAPGLTWKAADFDKCQSDDEIKSYVINLTHQSVDFLIISKNMSNRNWCLNRILRRMRSAAVFVDVQQGFEYGWLFRLSDVVATFRN
jgi:hypothetical protein